jgi:hypothetical protein
VVVGDSAGARARAKPFSPHTSTVQTRLRYTAHHRPPAQEAGGRMTVAVDLADALELEHDPAARVCAICGTALDARRADARHCGAACRREASRLRRLLAGEPVEGYRNLAEYLNARQRRAKRVWGAER